MSGRLLGLHGRAGAGKSTIARAMLDCAEPPAVLHFTSPIKTMARAFGLSEEQVNGASKDTPCDWLGGVTPRVFLQQLGAMLRSTIGEHDLAARAMVEADRLLAHGLDVIFDDVRTPAEAAAIWGRHGVVIELTGRASDQLDSDATSDSTERPLDERYIHTRVLNDSTPETTVEAVRIRWRRIASAYASREW